jgi:hypothetical protein
MNIPLGPEDIDGLVTAFEQALIALGINDRNHPMTELVAKGCSRSDKWAFETICRLAVHQK